MLAHKLKAAALSAAPADPYFNNVTLLLPGNGTNGAQNNTFLDSSSNNFTITRNGDTTQGTFSPFSQTGWSNYFDGSGDSVVTPTNSAFDGFGGGTSWQIDFWWWPISGAIQWDGPFETVGGAGIFFRNRSGYLDFVNNNDNAGLIRSDYPSLNRWHHIVLVCEGSTNQRSVFIDGVRTGTITNGAVFNNGSIGIATPGVGTFNAYISDFRVIKGSRTYDPAASTITVPTSPSTAVSGTVLLTCQGNRFRDASSNNFSLTVGGNTSVQAFSPFNPTAAYSAATNGGSGYFDGSGDWVQAGTSANLALGSGNFTIEGWHYCTGYNGGAALYSSINTYPSSTGLVFYIHSDGSYTVDVNGTALKTSDKAQLNAWVHYALVRSGSTMTVYANGVSLGTASSTTNFTDQYAVVGRTGAGTASNYFLGYLSSCRTVKGTAVYTGNFTPPTAPLTAISGTQLLLNFTNAGIIDATAKNDLVTVGNAQISTAQSKFGGGSMAFDGSGDSAHARAAGGNALYIFGTGDFTLEGWVYPLALGANGAAQQMIFCAGASGGLCMSVWTNYIRIAAADQANLVDNYSAAIVNNGWIHLAITRSNGTYRSFVNGVQAGSDTTLTRDFASASDPTVGAYYDNSTAFNGYIDDLRMTKGVARYTSNFTPPSAPFPLQ